MTTYWDYVRTEDLLALQGGVERDERRLSDAEVLFITVHQVFELWFKLVLRDLVTLRDLFACPVVPETAMARAARSLERIARILRVAVHHWEVVESLDPRDYLDFRDKLFPASGFQSAQMREIEILLGLQEDERVGLAAGGAWRQALRAADGSASPSLDRVEARLADRPSFREALDAWLFRTPIRGAHPGQPTDERVVEAFISDYLARLRAGVEERLEERLDGRLAPDAQEAVRQRYRQEVRQAEAWLRPEEPRRRRIRAAILFIEAYRDLPLLAWPREVLSRVVEVEQALLVFRQRHARMVERVIGRRVGTGGSSGVDYLEETATAYRVFPDLWAARTYLLPRESLPPLEDTTPYEFVRSLAPPATGSAGAAPPSRAP